MNQGRVRCEDRGKGVSAGGAEALLLVWGEGAAGFASLAEELRKFASLEGGEGGGHACVVTRGLVLGE